MNAIPMNDFLYNPMNGAFSQDTTSWYVDLDPETYRPQNLEKNEKTCIYVYIHIYIYIYHHTYVCKI